MSCHLRVLGRRRHDPAVRIDESGRKADVADGCGHARQLAELADKLSRDATTFREGEREVARRVDLLVGGDHDGGSGEAARGQVGAEAGLGEDAGRGDQGRAAEHRAGHGDQGGDTVADHL